MTDEATAPEDEELWRVRDLHYRPGDRSDEAQYARRMALERELYSAAATGTYGHAFTDDELAAARSHARAAGIRPDPIAEILGEPPDRGPAAVVSYAAALVRPPAFAHLKRRDPAQDILDSVDEELRREEQAELLKRSSDAGVVIKQGGWVNVTFIIDDSVLKQAFAKVAAGLEKMLSSYLSHAGDLRVSLGLDPVPVRPAPAVVFSMLTPLTMAMIDELREKWASQPIGMATPVADDVVREAVDVAVDRARDRVATSALARRRHGSAAVCPRHGDTRGGMCTRCAISATVY